MTMSWVLLRYAVEGIASSLRRLAPRNDNWGTRGETAAKDLSTWIYSRFLIQHSPNSYTNVVRNCFLSGDTLSVL